MSLVGSANCAVFNVFSAKVEPAGVVIDELASTVVVELGLFVGEDPFGVLCSGLGEERFVELPLVIQLGSGIGKSTIKTVMYWSNTHKIALDELVEGRERC